LEFENRRAVAVHYVRGRGAGTQRVVARREIIICAGAANSPKLLQLSGIGAHSHLESLGIDTILHLPGVGENLRDHYVVRSVARVRGVKTINDDSRGLRFIGQLARWALGRPSILTLSPSVAYAYWQSSQNVAQPDVMLVFTPASYVASVSGLLDRFPGMTLGFGQMRPRSTGYVRVTSRDPFQAPEIQPNYLSASQDRQVVVDALRLTRRLLEAPPLARHVEQQVSPPADCTSDDELLDFARKAGNTSYHLLGTCRMGLAEDRLAVVDEQLRIRGVEGLRVADASIMPDIPSANTMASVLAIAEKAADMILGRPALREAGLAIHATAAASMPPFTAAVAADDSSSSIETA
jgi:choline dehydrogenase